MDEGEASAIALALETKNCLLIIDEKKGRKLARTLHIKIAGTLQILLLAKSKGIITSLAQLLSQLEEKNFRFSTGLKEEILKKANEG
jgi:predicted nucleic acid-binding protein